MVVAKQSTETRTIIETSVMDKTVAPTVHQGINFQFSLEVQYL